jgi:hypothetical protein
MKKEAKEVGGGDGGATNSHCNPSDRPRKEKLCTLLLPPLQRRRDAYDNARVTRASCVGGHTGRQTPSLLRAVAGVSQCATGAPPNVPLVDEG